MKTEPVFDRHKYGFATMTKNNTSKRAKFKVSRELLEDMLNLPPGNKIVFVEKKDEDWDQNVYTFYVEGDHRSNLREVPEANIAPEVDLVHERILSSFSYGDK